MWSLSISASMIYKNERRYKIGHYKKYNTNLLNLVGKCSSRYADSKYARIGKDEESASTAN